MKILDNQFSNVIKIFEERLYYSKNLNMSKNFTDKITFEDIVIENENNISKLEELRFYKNISYGINTCTIIIILVLALAFRIIYKSRNYKLKVCNGNQENSNLKGGKVMYSTYSESSKTPNLKPDIKSATDNFDNLLQEITIANLK